MLVVMQPSFYFYDVETSGINARNGRIMQFAGQKTDMSLKQIDKPDNFLIKITNDILPDPDAVLITGITPQQTLAEGISEAEFLKYFYKNIAQPGTIFIGFNNVRFDDEFIRFTNYRNFYDAYEWQWQNSRSRWDLLDVTRMTRALRPQGIVWPFGDDGKPSNKLELITNSNKLNHQNAHDALSDVKATIDVARLIKQKQPKLFEYLLSIKDKKVVEKLVANGEPFVYTSGRYASHYEKTTVAITVANHPSQSGSVYVYDLRVDPSKYTNTKPVDMARLLNQYELDDNETLLPVKQLSFNRCPAVAPLSVLDNQSQARIKIDLKQIQNNLTKLQKISDFGDRLTEAIRINEKLKQTTFAIDIKDVDSQLYDGFFNDSDKTKMQKIVSADASGLADLHLDFADSRLEKLLLLYKARQYPISLSADEQVQWEAYRVEKLLGGNDKSLIARYFNRINELFNTTQNKEKQYLLEELKLYGESILPTAD